jgi:hypothetical protein
VKRDRFGAVCNKTEKGLVRLEGKDSSVKEENNQGVKQERTQVLRRKGLRYLEEKDSDIQSQNGIAGGNYIEPGDSKGHGTRKRSRMPSCM